VALEFDNIESIKKGIEVGAGLALLPEPTFRQEAKAGTIRAIPLFLERGVPRLVRPLGIIHRRHRLSSAAVGFIELLRGNGEAPPAEESNSDASPEPHRNGERPHAAPKVNGTSHNRRTRKVR
jgi:DNA-binding transcriptional LysR family regulator